MPLMDLKLMHKKWLADPTMRYEEYHPEFVGCLEAMKAFRLRGSDWIESQGSDWTEFKAEINLPFSVQIFIHFKCNLAWRNDNTRMV